MRKSLNLHFHPLEPPQERIQCQTYSGVSMRSISHSRSMDIIHPMHSIDYAFGEFSFALDQPSVGFIDSTRDIEISIFYAMYSRILSYLGAMSGSRSKQF